MRSDYCANASYLKDCYLLFNSNRSEDSAYGNGVDLSRNCYDNSHVQRCERCYDSFWLTNCYDTNFSSQCEDCVSVQFSKNCKGCSHCIGCVNLRNKSYCFLNEQLTEKEYKRRLAELRLDTWTGLSAFRSRARAHWLKFPVKSMQGVGNTNVSGEYITHSKNVYRSYLIRESEDLRYVQYSQVPSSRDVMDATITGAMAEQVYETSVGGWTSGRLKFCWECWAGGRDLEYCMFCGKAASDLFGCVGITKQQYCILNKQYSKDEYLRLRQKIIEHMNSMPYVDKQGRVYKYGEFFPPEFSPFAFNHSIAPEHFPLLRDEVIAFGSRWEDPHPTEYQTTMSSSALPDSIEEVSDSILGEIIQCVECKRAYRIIEAELKFLRQAGIPAPRTCVDCRHTARILQRNRSELHPRRCDCVGQKSDNSVYTNQTPHFHGQDHCPNEFETSFAPERPEIVYCEACYQSEVV